MERRQFIIAATIGLVASTLLTLGSHAEAGGLYEHHPFIRKAIDALEAAKTDMEAADHDFGGHRKDALDAIHNARVQLKKCLDNNKGASLLVSDGQAETGIHEHHPFIRKAIDALEAAKTDMEAADHDFGGHRKDALDAIHDARVQLKKCLDNNR